MCKLEGLTRGGQGHHEPMQGCLEVQRAQLQQSREYLHHKSDAARQTVPCLARQHWLIQFGFIKCGCVQWGFRGGASGNSARLVHTLCLIPCGMGAGVWLAWVSYQVLTISVDQQQT